MITIIEVNFEIIRMNQFIEKKYPELSKFIQELPVTVPNKKNPVINIKHLLNYYESLLSMVTHYQKVQKIKTQNGKKNKM